MATPRAESRRPIWLCIAFVVALTAWRVAWLALSRLDLFTDESQYWFWSTELALGYFSKPPLIAWIIRAATELGGSSDPFWVRLPAPLMQGATALAVAWVGALAYGNRRGALAGIVYATLPAASVASTVISTDTPLLLCMALAIGLWIRLSERPSAWLAVALGVVAGVGMLAKYAMLYFWLGAALSAVLVPRLRPPLRPVLTALGVFLLTVAPNLVWNALEGFVTLTHTVHNAGWGTDWFHPLKLLEFLGSQFGVFGPITFAALCMAWLGARRGHWADRGLTLFSLPIMAIVSFQALRSEANPNWAAAAFVAGAPLAAAWLAQNAPRGLKLALALHLAVALALPVAARFPETFVMPNGRSVFARMIGRESLAQEIGDMAREAGVSVVIADNRGLVSDLLYVLRDSGLTVRTFPPQGPPRHHFDMAVPLPPGTHPDALWITDSAAPPLPAGYAESRLLRTWQPTQPFFSKYTISAHLLHGARP